MSTRTRKSIERRFEATLFAARWLAAPIYLGLVAALVMLLVVFGRELVFTFPTIWRGSVESGLLHEVVLGALRLIDIALVANLVLIVILAGYENFVSRIEISEADDRLSWMGTIDFSGLKLKLFASMVAITGIELLKAFMGVIKPVHDAAGESAAAASGSSALAESDMRWLVIIHATFLFTTVLAALTDWLAARSRAHVPGGRPQEVR